MNDVTVINILCMTSNACVPFYSIACQYVPLNVPDWAFKHQNCVLYAVIVCPGLTIVRGPVQPTPVKATLASALNDGEMQWLILSRSTIDNHIVTSPGITSAALHWLTKPCRAKYAGTVFPTELRST